MCACLSNEECQLNFSEDLVGNCEGGPSISLETEAHREGKSTTMMARWQLSSQGIHSILAIVC